MYGEPNKLTARANDALSLWQVPRHTRATLINLSENATFLVSAPSGFKAVLRLHRPGYHTLNVIESELRWIEDLRASGAVETPLVILGKDGNAVQKTFDPDKREVRFWALFGFLPGAHPDGNDDLPRLFKHLGNIAARCHNHAEDWSPPASFERPSWDADAIFGPKALWGDWWDAPGVTPSVRRVLEEAEVAVCERLKVFGKAKSKYNLIHADMRMANLLVSNAKASLIDFDDCGFGWFMYDFAASVSFMEDDPRIAELKAHWLDGYTAVRALSESDIAEIPTFVMMRRLALLAWIGSRRDSSEPRALAPTFANITKKLASDWLDGNHRW